MDSAMTPEQALDLLNQLRLKSALSYADHQLALNAYEVLKAAIAPKATDKPCNS